MFHDKTFWFGIVSAAVNVFGYIPYIKGTVQRRIKPHRITWGIWSILTTIALVNQIHNGGGYSAYFIASTGLLVITIFILSIFKGVGGSSGFDQFILIASIILFVTWAVTKNTTTTTLLAVSIDALGALPTVYKAYKHPETENYMQWILSVVAGMFSILAIARPEFILLVYPVYVVLMDATTAVAKYVGSKRVA